MMQNEKLIELVSEITYLYDPNDKYYCDTNRKEQAWREIGKKLKVNDTECKKTWCLLRDSFRRALKKNKKRLRGEPAKQWKYEEEMSFLLPYIRERNRKSKINTTIDDITDDEIKEEIIDEMHDNDNTIHNYNLSPPACPEVPISYDDSLAANVANVKKTDDTNPYVMDYVIGNQNHQVDDVQLFFNSIATTVRTFSLKERAIVKAKIFEIVSEMEIDMLNRTSTS